MQRAHKAVEDPERMEADDADQAEDGEQEPGVKKEDLISSGRPDLEGKAFIHHLHDIRDQKGHDDETDDEEVVENDQGQKTILM
jgi:hypothetical protein